MSLNREPDLLIVGGGIVGCAACRDAAGRGLSVVLCEMNDLGSGTTSRTSRMCHGGLRYLEHFRFGLVRESLRERNMLFRAAPELVERRRFMLPTAASTRRGWYVACGLALYDLLSMSLDARREKGGFSYIDGLCSPERLAAALAAEAESRGAEILTYSRIISVDAQGTVRTAEGEEFRPKAIIVAAGPWTDRVLAEWGISFPRPVLAPTRGTHLLLSSEIDSPRLLQASSDGRVFFALPSYGGALVGTTDLDDASDPASVKPLDEEIEYLVTELRRYLPELGTDVRGAWTGVRPLVNDAASASARSREELITVHPRVKNMIVAVGGKLTTMRSMAEKSVNMVERVVLKSAVKPWTWNARLAPAAEDYRVAHLADAMLRRTDAAFRFTGERFARECTDVCARFGWSEERIGIERARLKREALESFGIELFMDRT